MKLYEGDACNLEGVDDHSFDLDLSVFGAMFAPKPYDVAREMVRVTKRGGRIVMGNRIPNDTTSFVSQLLKISASFLQPGGSGGSLALRAMAIAAGIIGRLAVTAVVTSVDVTAEHGRAAGGQDLEDDGFRHGQRVALQVLGSVLAEDVANFEPWTRARSRTRGVSRASNSRGLIVLCSNSGVTWV